MAVKHYVDDIPPSTGRVYEITASGNRSTIKDVTNYEQVGTVFNAGVVNQVCVLECDYSKSGTVHALTTPNIASENIKFKATSAFNSGDTFTFNGTAVTAQTTDGQALGTNFFVANTIVECKKQGNVLYFASSSKFITDDSTKAAFRFGIENGMLYVEED